MKLRELFEADIIQFPYDKKKEMDIGVVVNKVQNALVSFYDLEKLADKKLKELLKEFAQEQKEIIPSSPTLMAHYRKGLSPFEYLKLNLPLYFDVEGMDLRDNDNLKSTSFAISILLEKGDQIIKQNKSEITRLNKFARETQTWHNSAYVFDAVKRIGSLITERNDMIELVEHSKRHHLKWVKYQQKLNQIAN